MANFSQLVASSHPLIQNKLYCLSQGCQSVIKISHNSRLEMNVGLCCHVLLGSQTLHCFDKSREWKCLQEKAHFLAHCFSLAPMVRYSIIAECAGDSRDAYLIVTARKGVCRAEDRQTERQMHTKNVRMPLGLESFNFMLSSDPSFSHNLSSIMPSGYDSIGGLTHY